jgi:hypothetical protein
MVGRWQDLNYTIQQARRTMQKEGWTTLPSSRVLASKGYSGLAAAITKYHGSITKFRITLGQENVHGRWRNICYAKQQAQQAMQMEGWATLPSHDVLDDKGYGSLGRAIIKYHGGLPNFRKILGQENQWGRWTDPAYAKQQARQAMQKEGWTILPSEDVLREKGYGGLASSIGVHHGGMPAFRTTLGQENMVGRWQDLNYTIQQARQAMQKEGWIILPSSHVLSDKGYGSISFAISKYHGGFTAFRELLAKAQGQPTHKEQLEKLLSNYVDQPHQDYNAALSRVPE